MERKIYRYKFSDAVSLDQVQELLTLAVLATEGLHGRSRLRLDGAFLLEKRNQCCVVDATTDLGQDLSRILTGLLIQEIGEESFDVERGGGPGKKEKGGETGGNGTKGG